MNKQYKCSYIILFESIIQNTFCSTIHRKIIEVSTTIAFVSKKNRYLCHGSFLQSLHTVASYMWRLIVFHHPEYRLILTNPLYLFHNQLHIFEGYAVGNGMVGRENKSAVFL